MFTFLLAFEIVGTGGMLTDGNISKFTPYMPALEIIETSHADIDKFSVVDQIILIRDIFGLNTSDLAVILGVTRPTIYAWLEGQGPKIDSILHIKKLFFIAAELKQFNIPRMDTIIRRPIFEGGYSILDKLRANEDLKEYFPFLKSIAEKEALNRKIHKDDKPPRRSSKQAASDYSNPFHRD